MYPLQCYHEHQLADQLLLLLDVIQIYFVEKDFTGESDLYSIFDFDDSTRGDIGYYKRYMKGAFGAIPNIDAKNLVKMFASDKEV